MDPSRPPQGVGRGQPQQKGQGDGKGDRLSYFRDNIQDPHELEDYDPSDYYYQREKGAALPGGPPPTGVPGSMGLYPPFFNAPPGPPGQAGAFVSPGPHTMPPNSIATRPAMPGQGPPLPVGNAQAPNTILNQQQFSGAQVGMVRAYLNGPTANSGGQPPQMQPPVSAAPGTQFNMQNSGIMARQPAPISLAIAGNAQNAPRGITAQPTQPQAPPTQPVQAAPVRAPAEYRPTAARPASPSSRLPASYSAAAVSKTVPVPETSESTPPTFDTADFPALQGFSGASPESPSGLGSQFTGGSLVDHKSSVDFSIHNAADFPALGGGEEGMGQVIGSLKSQAPPVATTTATDSPPVAAGQWQKPFARPTGPSQTQTPQSRSSQQSQQISSVDRYGLLGLLGVIRMSDVDHTTLALGTDLTTLGLNLNSPELLYESFSSPWADAPGRREPDFTLPACYYLQPPLAPPMAKLPFVTEETLFYIFYGVAMEGLQKAAAKELFTREWRYHKVLKLWFKKAGDVEPQKGNSEAGSYVYFDLNSWERVQKENLTLNLDQLAVDVDGLI